MRTLIAMPVYNELKYVAGVIQRVKQFCPNLLVVDDGSTDGTGELLETIHGINRIVHSTNLGYGQSLIDAFNWAARRGFDWVITMDCDEQHEPERIPDFLREMESDEWDIISGSRYLATSGGDDLPPPDRRSINATITETINALFGLSLTDSFCGFKAHRVSAMKKLQLTEKGYAFPMQLWPQAWANGLRIREIPVRLIYNDPTRHFGGMLDDAGRRLKHYLGVLGGEIQRLAKPTVPTEVPCSCCCGE
ncbi:MAG TPA: glycosyltransferase family 2 protein [Tepidisphaeraceae bacterium]|nr:glycosyltransferase family 2 protein [Tepidisphaeraceae bacterium]